MYIDPEYEIHSESLGRPVSKSKLIIEAISVRFARRSSPIGVVL